MQTPFGATPFIASFQIQWGGGGGDEPSPFFTVVSALNCQITTVGGGNARTPNYPPSTGPQTFPPTAATFIVTLNQLPGNPPGLIPTAFTNNENFVNDGQVEFTSQELGKAPVEIDIAYGPGISGYNQGVVTAWVPALAANEVAIRYNGGTGPTGFNPAGSGGGNSLLLNGTFTNCQDRKSVV
jgi:hypothetical protein